MLLLIYLEMRLETFRRRTFTKVMIRLTSKFDLVFHCLEDGKPFITSGTIFLVITTCTTEVKASKDVLLILTHAFKL